MWTYLRDERRWDSDVPPAVFFEFAMSRAATHPYETLLSSAVTILTLDAYSGYNEILATGLQRASCHAHARRKFVEAQRIENAPVATEIISLYAKIYAHERETWTLGRAERERRRQGKLLPIFEEMEAMLRYYAGRVREQSVLGKAIRYWLNQRDDLMRFLYDGRVEIDNNPIENAIRRMVIVRKNALFAGSKNGAQTWAFYSSLIETCRLNGVDPLGYFNWLFEKVEGRHPLARYNELLPWHCPVGRRRDMKSAA